jgi:hypothetical protein|tara:strand:+ start:327 stop:491 length:165 start_codon:yes stop_codon:yes gene_type:complete
MKTDYNKVVERKDVTVENMFKIYKKNNRLSKRITWDNYYLVTGWEHTPRTKDER